MTAIPPDTTGSPTEPDGAAATRRPRGDFRRLWLATTASQLGTQVSELAIPLAAILLLHAGALQVGLLATLGYLPLAIFGLPAGVWADRLPRRAIMLAADIMRAVVLATVPLAYLVGELHMAQLYVVTACVGALTVFFDVAYAAYVPSLAMRDELARANSRLQLSEQSAGVAGPGLAGWLIGAIGAPLAISADAVSYAISAAFVGGIRHREVRVSAPTATRVHLRAQIVDGIREVASHRQLRAIAICAAVINLFGRMMVILVPLYLVRAAGYRPTAIGVVFTIGSVGFVVGAARADRVVERLGLGRAIVVGASVATASLILIAAPPAALAGPFVAAAMFVYGMGAVTFTVGNATLRQLTVAPDMLGRTGATMRVLTWIAQPIAGVLAAWLGTVAGIHVALWVGAVGVLLAPVPLVRSGLAEQARATDRHAPMTSS